MSTYVVETDIVLPPEEAFDTYVNKVDTWWPRKGVFPYSFAPEGTAPKHIHFEPRAGGRYYETFADGSEYVMGTITTWEPPRYFSFNWRDPSWSGSITYAITFHPIDGGARLAVAVSGFAEAGVADMAPFYRVGDRQISAVYAAHCRAIADLRALQG